MKAKKKQRDENGKDDLKKKPDSTGIDTDADKTGTDEDADVTEDKSGKSKGKFDKPKRELDPDRTGIDTESDKTKPNTKN